MARRCGTCVALISLLIAVVPWPSVSAQHTLGAGSSLSVEDHARPFLVSPDATFSCGFLDAGENAFSFSVWYTHAADKTPIWTANPSAPVNGRGSKITFRRDGRLALDDANGTTVWESTTSGGGGGGAMAISLLDTGNLVISGPSTTTVVWQSFDWPTDTLVPSQPLTKDTKLVAGYFSLYYDNDNVLRLLYDGPEISSIYWPDPDNNPFQNGRTTYNSSRIGVLDGNGFFLSSDNFGVNASDLGLPGVNRRLSIGQDGNVRIYSMNVSTGEWTVTWAALAQPCSVHGLCGKNAICEYQPRLRCSCAPGYEMVDRQDRRRGCKPMFRTVTNCSLPASKPEQRYKFVKMPHTDFYGYDLWFYQSVTFEFCKKICLEMCLCAGFSYKFQGQGDCYLKSVLFNGYTSSSFPGTIYVKVPIDFDASPAHLGTARRSTAGGLACNPNDTVTIQGSPAMFRRSGNGTKWTYLFAFAGVLGLVDLIFIVTGCWFLSSHQQSIPSSLEPGYRMVAGQFRRFTYRELKDATGNFKEELGRGGSGVVYRGVLDKGKVVVAVKKLTNVSRGDEEFWAEMTVIGRINHINLVRIRGFCSQGKHKLLVYEYVENESLDKHLFDPDRTLPWRDRFRIALGTARGLAYLHHECLEWVIHCDVKPENILLTREFDAKIADFGLAKLSKREGATGDSSLELSHMRGTTGYMAPEWALNVPINAKVDVYSYGIVLLEMVIGRRVSDQTTAGGERLEMPQIARLLRQVVDTGNVVPLVDGRLQGQFNPRQALEMVRISLSCMEERCNRPTMDDIAKVLTACDDEDEHPAYRS
ncbi:hypothetical protein HU200_047249 [Digitaria exilis]|uniref:Receptor-like serine/threonine-protein kinase n=1 Tax=Digitaria exilis TaxID=1010633 RepID=A0A835AXU8_9POAL|nr:hypothetical protein HU200_047249 [Digitaria exilis]